MSRLLAAAGDSGTIVALALIVGDTVLHLVGKPVAVYDEAVPVIVALYLGGHIARTTATATAAVANGKLPPPS